MFLSKNMVLICIQTIQLLRSPFQILGFILNTLGVLGLWLGLVHGFGYLKTQNWKRTLERLNVLPSIKTRVYLRGSYRDSYYEDLNSVIWNDSKWEYSYPVESHKRKAEDVEPPPIPPRKRPPPPEKPPRMPQNPETTAEEETIKQKKMVQHLQGKLKLHQHYVFTVFTLHELLPAPPYSRCVLPVRFGSTC